MGGGIESLNFALTFAVELAAIAGYGFWGYSLGRTPQTKWLLAALLVGVIIGFWALFFAPTAQHRLPARLGVPLSGVIFLLGSLGYYLAGKPAFAFVLAAAAIINRILAWLWAQW